MSYALERTSAIEAVLTACWLIRNVGKAHFPRNAMIKRDRSPVTVADFGVQAIINDRLRKAFPGDLIVAEENSRLLVRDENVSLLEAVVDQVGLVNEHLSPDRILETIDLGSAVAGPEGRFWVLDPIDGTKGFLRGDQYAVALALLDEGRVVLGVLGCPNLPLHGTGQDSDRGCLFVAGRGEGAEMLGFDHQVGERIQVASVTDPSLARACESFEPGHSMHGMTLNVGRELGITMPPLRLDSQAKYGVVARGDASLYLRVPPEKTYREKIWDHAAGSILVEEAGGRVTDVEGKPLDFSRGNQLLANRGIIATNGKLHDAFLGALKRELSRT